MLDRRLTRPTAPSRLEAEAAAPEASARRPTATADTVFLGMSTPQSLMAGCLAARCLLDVDCPATIYSRCRVTTAMPTMPRRARARRLPCGVNREVADVRASTNTRPGSGRRCARRRLELVLELWSRVNDGACIRRTNRPTTLSVAIERTNQGNSPVRTRFRSSPTRTHGRVAQRWPTAPGHPSLSRPPARSPAHSLARVLLYIHDTDPLKNRRCGHVALVARLRNLRDSDGAATCDRGRPGDEPVGVYPRPSGTPNADASARLLIGVSWVVGARVPRGTGLRLDRSICQTCP